MPKYVKTPDPDAEYNQGHIRLVRLGSTIYLYLVGEIAMKVSVHPVMTRKCGDDRTAQNVFYRLRYGFSESRKKRSLWDRLRMLWWRLTE